MFCGMAALLVAFWCHWKVTDLSRMLSYAIRTEQNARHLPAATYIFFEVQGCVVHQRFHHPHQINQKRQIILNDVYFDLKNITVCKTGQRQESGKLNFRPHFCKNRHEWSREDIPLLQWTLWNEATSDANPDHLTGYPTLPATTTTVIQCKGWVATLTRYLLIHCQGSACGVPVRGEVVLWERQ